MGTKLEVKTEEKALYPFVRVRVTEVQVYVSDVKTSTGMLYVRVSGGGGHFEDRNMER